MAHKVTLTMPCNCSHPTDHGELSVYLEPSGVKGFADAVAEERRESTKAANAVGYRPRKGGNRRK